MLKSLKGVERIIPLLASGDLLIFYGRYFAQDC